VVGDKIPAVEWNKHRIMNFGNDAHHLPVAVHPLDATYFADELLGI
jgi:hypothetical protein